MAVEPETTSSRRIDTRSMLAILVVLNIMGLTGYLAWTKPESDQFTLLLGMLGGMTSAIIGYYFGSSSGSEKKDETQARVAARLAEKVGNMLPETPKEPKVSWWTVMTPEEQSAINGATTVDGNVGTIVAALAAGTAKPEDLDYLVNAGLLSADRATALKAM